MTQPLRDALALAGIALLLVGGMALWAIVRGGDDD